MTWVALHTVLQPDRGEDYDRLHQRIPEDVAAALAEHGVREWRIWRDGEHVFHLVDVEDYAAMRAAMEPLPANQEWQATVAPLFAKADSYDLSDSDPAMTPLWSLSDQLGQG